MLNDAPTAGRRRARTKERVHYRPAKTAIPDEPGRVLTNAAVSLAREADGKTQIWDDRVETAVSLLRRVMYKRAHGEKSAAFACAFAEIVYALGAGGAFPKSGAPPRFRGAGWDEYFQRNRTSAQRWCERAETAGLLAVVGEVDNTGQWWRVLVRVLELAPVDETRVRDARDRLKGFERRRRRSDLRGVKRDLRGLSDGAEPLSAAERKRRRLAAQKVSARRRFSVKGDLAHPKEALRPSDAPHASTSRDNATSTHSSHRRGAHARGVPSLRSENRLDRRPKHGASHNKIPKQPEDQLTEGEGVGGDAGLQESRPSGALAGYALGSLEPRDALRGPGGSFVGLTAQIASMAPTADLMSPWVVAAIVRAWWQIRRGLPSDTAAVQQDVDDALSDAGRHRIRAASYEHHVAHRPPGWPTAGAAALLTLAVIHDLPPFSLELGALAAELGELMRAEHDHGPSPTVAGYEGHDALRRRLTEQLRAAGDSIDLCPTLRAAENAAIAHEHAGLLPTSPDETGRWVSPTAQRAWRHRFLPPLPHRLTAAATEPTDPGLYLAAITAIERSEPGTALSAAMLEQLVQAFHARRYGIDGATARPNWRPRAARQQIAAVVDAYEAFPDDIRPVGWPKSGLAALLHLATWRDPGSRTLGGKPVHMRRPEHLPMALARLHVINEEMRRYADRQTDIETAKRRRHGRGGRTTNPSTQPQAPPKLQFRAAAGPSPIESPDQTYARIRRQLLACGDHPADHASLEDAELALIEHEQAGHLPPDTGPSPSQMRTARLESPSNRGPQGVADREWEHLTTAATGHLTPADASHLTDLTALGIHQNRLILTGPSETLAWAKRTSLTALLDHLARQLDIAHSTTLVDARYASAFAPPAELTGPADGRAARGDRYLLERDSRYAI